MYTSLQKKIYNSKYARTEETHILAVVTDKQPVIILCILVIPWFAFSYKYIEVGKMTII